MESPPITSRAKLAEGELSHFIAALRDGLGELHRCYDELLGDLVRSIAQAFAIDGTSSQVRLRLAERAVAIKDWVADPALKSFIFRISDQSLDDLLWLESLVALLTQKPPSGWRDEDRAKFEVGLANMARLFAHVEGLAFTTARRQAPQGEEDAIRIGITTRTQPELERVIYISGSERAEVARLKTAVHATLGEAGRNGNGHVAAAALAGLMQELLGQ